MSEKIRALSVKPQEYANPIEIDNSLKSLQKYVDGLIEVIYPSDDTVVMICNEEGKMNALPPNRALFTDGSKKIVDLIVGNMLICGVDDDGNFASLTDEQLQHYQAMYYEPEYFLPAPGGILWLRGDGHCENILFDDPMEP